MIEKPHVIQLAGYNKMVDQGSFSKLIAKGEACSLLCHVKCVSSVRIP